jgi:putative serine protease PepD
MGEQPRSDAPTPSWWRAPGAPGEAADTQPVAASAPDTQPLPAPSPAPEPLPAPPPEPPTGPLAGHGGTDFPSGPDAEPLGARDPRRRRSLVLALLGVAVLLLASLGAGYAGSRLAGGPARTPGSTVAVAGPSAAAERPTGSVAQVAAAVLPSVVSIEVTFAGGQATGSGFVIGADGLILTNNHVVAEALTGGRIEVVFADGSQERAEVVGHTTPYDLAVLRVDRSGLPVLEFADSDSVVVGDPVVAVGAPLGLESTVTSGIVSALNRPVSAGAGDSSAFINAIQTDAAINPGNSGGPLVDLSGRVIGINSAIARAPGTGGESGGNIGLGFAIPSDQASRTAQELIDTGKATYPVIGVLLDRNHSGEGVKVVETPPDDGQPIITPGGPADKAGIRPGDLIVAFEGRPVTDPDELIVAIRAQRPGDTVTLTVRRGDTERDVRLTLDKAESD